MFGMIALPVQAITITNTVSSYAHTGNNGQAGTDGRDGQAGTDGRDGQPGTNGSDGADGQDGNPGRDGVTAQQHGGSASVYISSTVNGKTVLEVYDETVFGADARTDVSEVTTASETNSVEVNNSTTTNVAISAAASVGEDVNTQSNVFTLMPLLTSIRSLVYAYASNLI